MSQIRVVIADDDVLLREGLASLLTQAGLDVVGRAGDAEELLALLEKDPPDLAIIDIRMPPTYTAEGLDAAVKIRDRFPDVSTALVCSRRSRSRTRTARQREQHRQGYGLPAQEPCDRHRRLRLDDRSDRGRIVGHRSCSCLRTGCGQAPR